MPEPRLPMRKVRDVLRLSAAGLSKRKIAASLGMSATAARDCIWRARRAGLAWPLPADLTGGTAERVGVEYRDSPAAQRPLVGDRWKGRSNTL
jgi:transposase